MRNLCKQFELEKKRRIKLMSAHKNYKRMGVHFIKDTAQLKYSYNFTWLGRPIIQYPPDIIAMQEIIWDVKPDLIIETGIAHGGSLIFYASLLELLGKGRVLGIDIEIRSHNKKSIQSHFLHKRISLLEGSSVSKEVLKKVAAYTRGKKKILVCLDSNHTHEHVLCELNLYSSFVSKGSYLVVFDTVIEDLPDSLNYNRPWKKGNSPKSAVRNFLKKNKNFKIDRDVENKLIITTNPDGYLKRIR